MVDRSRLIKCTEQEVVDCYLELRTSNGVAKKLGIGQSTVLRILAKNNVVTDGLEAWRAAARSFDPAQDAEVRAEYEGGAWSADLARKYGVTIYAIKQAIKRSGGVLRANPAPTVRPGEAEEIAARYSAGASQVEVSLITGRSQSFIGQVLRSAGLSRRAKQGPLHNRWKGGRFFTGEGYVRVWVSMNDPLACMRNNRGHVLEHRLVMARSLGRPLAAHETVHHIDGDKANNALGNLQLRKGRHGKGVSMHCADCGSHNVVAAEL